jgi:uncharacterized caspase-like protein
MFNRKKLRRVGSGILYAALLVICITIAGQSFAAETRGLRITAKDNASGEKKEVKIYNKSYAVIIGIDQYPNLKFDEQLAYAVRDAKGVEQVLRKNFKFDKIITLYNKDASKDSIMKVLLGDLSREVTDQDAVFVFWASHGYTEKTSFGDIGYLIPYDGTFNTSELYKNISMTTLKNDISQKIPAKHVFYVMDACYSGLLATTRGTTRKSARDYSYIQEITREKVRQVLTAGDKGQEVLDGGPRGHSVFTGRFIEFLEGADDFVTATEISTMLREKVFSDARSRNHTQTPKYGELFGVGDFVFVPSLEQKAEDTQAKVTGLQKELELLKATEVAAEKAKDERARRQAELEKRSIEAKLKAEQLRQQALEEERKKKEHEERERRQQEIQLASKKKADEERLATLKKDVEEKRKVMGGTVLSSLSPEATLTDAVAIDARIKQIKDSFRSEFANGIKQISTGFSEKLVQLGRSTKDEFESEAEFNDRIRKRRKTLAREQNEAFLRLQRKIQSEYNIQIAPFLKQLKKLSTTEFALSVEDLNLTIEKYDAVSNSYPVTIRSKQPIRGVMIAARANIPIPREEAREFKTHYENNMLRPEISGSFQTSQFFRVARARVIDEATNKTYDLFSSKFVDMENGVVYDTVTRLLWLADANYFYRGKTEIWGDNYRKGPPEACRSLSVAGLAGWRIPTKAELERMFPVYHGAEPHPFKNLSDKSYRSSTVSKDWGFFFVSLKNRSSSNGTSTSGWMEAPVWPVLGDDWDPTQEQVEKTSSDSKTVRGKDTEKEMHGDQVVNKNEKAKRKKTAK